MSGGSDSNPRPAARRWSWPRYSLRSLLLFVWCFGAVCGLWFQWDAWAPVRVLPGDFKLYSAAFSPDGEQIYASCRGEYIRTWDVASGASLAQWRDDPGTFAAQNVSPDGARCLTASLETKARLWDLRSGRCLFTFSSFGNAVLAAKFSPDGYHLLTFDYKGTIRVWRRRRPEWWWGHFYRAEVWATLLLSIALAWSLKRDRRLVAAK